MNRLKELLSRASETFEYTLHGAILSFTEQMTRIMAIKHVSRRDIAQKLGCPPPYITKVFRGNPNLTLASMVKIAGAVDCEIEIALHPKRVHQASNVVTTSQPGVMELDQKEFTDRFTASISSSTLQNPANIESAANNELPFAA